MIPLAILSAPTEVRAVTPTPGASQIEQAETVKPVFATARARSWVSTAQPSHKARRCTRCSRPGRPWAGRTLEATM